MNTKSQYTKPRLSYLLNGQVVSPLFGSQQCCEFKVYKLLCIRNPSLFFCCCWCLNFLAEIDLGCNFNFNRSVWKSKSGKEAVISCISLKIYIGKTWAWNSVCCNYNNTKVSCTLRRKLVRHIILFFFWSFILQEY